MKKSPVNESVLKMRGSEMKRREMAQRRVKRHRVMAKAKAHASNDTGAERDTPASSVSVTAKVGALTKSRAKASTANMPPRMAAKKQSAADRKDQLKESLERVQKENARLNTLIAKLTKSGDNVKPKQLYFDENWLAARLGMSVKYVRALRYKGEGPKVTYLGRNVRYRLREVLAYEAANTFPSRSAKDEADKD